jgi:kinetochore protein NDC80
MERKTLGNISVNRVSEVRQSLALKPKVSSTNSRTSSVGSGNGSSRTVKKQDSRPIGQSSFTQKCVKDIVSYLSTTQQGFDKELGVRLLKSPLTRDFLQVMDFLVRRMDQNFKAFVPALQEKKKGTQSTPFDMEIIIVLFDFLGYPIPINKRNLISVGAPHSWPTILAAVHWLVELSKYQDSTNGNSSSLDDKEDAMQFFMYLSRSYKTFLHHEGSDMEHMEDELRKFFHEKDKETLYEVEKLQFDVSNLEQQLAYESPLLSLEKKKMDFETEIEKLKKLLIVREDSKKKLDESKANLDQECISTLASIKKMQFENEMLKKQISMQDLKPEDVKRMNSELQQLEHNFSHHTKRYEELRARDWDNESTLKADSEVILSTTQTYNKLVVQEKYLIDSNRFDSLTLHQNLKVHYHELVAKLRSSHEFSLSLKEQLERNEWEKTELSDNQQQLNNKVVKLENEFRKEKETWRTDLQQQAVLIDQIEEEVRNLKIFEQSDNELKSTMMELDRLQNEIESKRNKYDKEESTMTGLLYKALELMTEHKDKIEKNLNSVEEKFKTILANNE